MVGKGGGGRGEKEAVTLVSETRFIGICSDMCSDKCSDRCSGRCSDRCSTAVVGACSRLDNTVIVTHHSAESTQAANYMACRAMQY